ncbi:MAG: hypothetical protein P4L48_11280 [Mycobacterium sp.]|nr:hypothetical protein [Mycobacterium sp.]
MPRIEMIVLVTEWLRAIPDFELEPDFAPRFTFTQGGAIKPSRLPLRWKPSRSWASVVCSAVEMPRLV